MYPNMCFNLVFIWEVFTQYAFSDGFPEGYSVKNACYIGYNDKISLQCVF